MPEKKLRMLNILRVSSYLFFLFICSFWILDSGFPGYINWPITIIGLCLLVQMIFRIQLADLVLGGIMAFLSLYMLLAVTSDLADHYNGTKPVETFAMYFGFGYGIFGVALLAALAIVYTYFAKRRLAEA